MSNIRPQRLGVSLLTASALLAGACAEEPDRQANVPYANKGRPPAPQPGPAKPEAKEVAPVTVGIAAPAADATVPHVTQAQGRFALRDAQSDLWLVVKSEHAERFHPQNGPLRKGAGQSWATTAYIGSGPDKHAGEKFKLFLVAANGYASQTFADYQAASERDQSWPGISAIPDGAIILDAVHVMRE